MEKAGISNAWKCCNPQCRTVNLRRFYKTHCPECDQRKCSSCEDVILKTPEVPKVFWPSGRKLSPSPSQETWRPKKSHQSFLIDDDPEVEDGPWQPQSSLGGQQSHHHHRVDRVVPGNRDRFAGPLDFLEKLNPLGSPSNQLTAPLPTLNYDSLLAVNASQILERSASEPYQLEESTNLHQLKGIKPEKPQQAFESHHPWENPRSWHAEKASERIVTEIGAGLIENFNNETGDYGAYRTLLGPHFSSVSEASSAESDTQEMSLKFERIDKGAVSSGRVGRRTTLVGRRNHGFQAAKAAEAKSAKASSDLIDLHADAEARSTLNKEAFPVQDRCAMNTADNNIIIQAQKHSGLAEFPTDEDLESEKILAFDDCDKELQPLVDKFSQKLVDMKPFEVARSLEQSSSTDAPDISLSTGRSQRTPAEGKGGEKLQSKLSEVKRSLPRTDPTRKLSPDADFSEWSALSSIRSLQSPTTFPDISCEPATLEGIRTNALDSHYEERSKAVHHSDVSQVSGEHKICLSQGGNQAEFESSRHDLASTLLQGMPVRNDKGRAGWLRHLFGKRQEPPIRPELVRIRYICACGTLIWDDYPESRARAARILEQEMNTHFRKFASALGSPQNRRVGQLPALVMSSAFHAMMRACNLIAPGKQLRGGRETDLESEPNAAPPQAPEPKSFYLTCAPTGSRIPVLNQSPSATVNTDLEYFDLLRKVVQECNSTPKSWLNPRKITSIDYVKFELLFGNEHVQVCQSPDYPKNKDHYLPCKTDFDDENFCPWGPNTLLHFFEQRHKCVEHPRILARIPRKLKDKLIIGNVDEVLLGWGMHLVDGVDGFRVAFRIGVLGIAGLIISSLMGVLWAKLHGNDIQGGTGLTQCLMAFVTFLVTLFGLVGFVDQSH